MRIARISPRVVRPQSPIRPRSLHGKKSCCRWPMAFASFAQSTDFIGLQSQQPTVFRSNDPSTNHLVPDVYQRASPSQWYIYVRARWVWSDSNQSIASLLRNPTPQHTKDRHRLESGSTTVGSNHGQVSRGRTTQPITVRRCKEENKKRYKQSRCTYPSSLMPEP